VRLPPDPNLSGFRLYWLAFGAFQNRPIQLGAHGSIEFCGTPVNSCRNNRKPCSLTFKYSGENCSATRHHMESNKVTCSGDPHNASRVRIRVSNNSSATASSAEVYFNGLVDINETFTALSSNAGRTRFPADSWFHVISTSGTVLQTLKIHTSCSEPLVVDDRFGSLKLTAVRLEGDC
jgi:hypothetical protein